MQAVAAEMNLSETAFVRRPDDGFELRWFTPKVEVDLCGHATLTSAHAMWNEGVVPLDLPIRFTTRSGLLTASRSGEFIELDFPATPVGPCEPPADLLDALAVEPTFVGKTIFDYLYVMESADAARSLQPNFQRLAELPTRGVIVTSRSDDAEFDFISRFFAPAVGVEEVRVTRSAHCCLAPFWSDRLGRTEMTGFQASSRGGINGLHRVQDNSPLDLFIRSQTVVHGTLWSKVSVTHYLIERHVSPPMSPKLRHGDTNGNRRCPRQELTATCELIQSVKNPND